MDERYFLTGEGYRQLREVVRRIMISEFDIDGGVHKPQQYRRFLDIREGTLDATLTAGSTTGVAMSVYNQEGGSWTDAGYNITVKWPDATIGPQIASGTWVVAVKINGEWRPIAADC